MTRVIFPEFRDQYENTCYPFADTASLTDTSGAVTIPKNTFLDAGFCFSEAFPYLAEIQVLNNQVFLTMKAGSETASCRLDLGALPDVLYFTDARNRQLGCLISEKLRLNWLASLPVGTYTFYPEAAPLAARCSLQAQVLGVSAICSTDTALTGDVWLVGGEGVSLRHMGNNRIRIDITGEVLHRRARCSADLPAQNCLKSINGIRANAYGGIVIGLAAGYEGKTKFRVVTNADGLEVKRV